MNCLFKVRLDSLLLLLIKHCSMFSNALTMWYCCYKHFNVKGKKKNVSLLAVCHNLCQCPSLYGS